MSLPLQFINRYLVCSFENSLNSVTEPRMRLNARSEFVAEVMSGFYGYCLGNAVALFGDTNPDGWKLTGGVLLSSVSFYYVYKMIKAATGSDAMIEAPYKTVGKHAALFGLMAASGCITNWDKFC